MFTRATTYNIIDRTYHDGGARLDSFFIRNILIREAPSDVRVCRQQHGRLRLSEAREKRFSHGETHRTRGRAFAADYALPRGRHGAAVIFEWDDIAVCVLVANRAPQAPANRQGSPL